jgi:hypothetical protein
MARTILIPTPTLINSGNFRHLREAWYFTKIDFMEGYFHILIKAKYRKLFAFATRRGVYQRTQLPQGWMNSRSTFQNRVDRA